VPKLFNAQRFGIDLTPYLTLVKIDEECRKLQVFEHAHPAQQPDSE
jgi:maleylpyruvate isomerase